MNEEIQKEILDECKLFFKKNKFNIKYNIVADSYSEFFYLEIWIPFKYYSRAKSLYESRLNSIFQTYILENNLTISLKKIMPNLVQAKLGNFVLICSESYRRNSIEEFDIGFVSSIFPQKDGTKLYGCRYVLPTVSSVGFEKHNKLFEFTKEDYGLLHSGFIKVFTKKQAIELIKAKIKVAYEKSYLEYKDKLNVFEKEIEDVLCRFKNEYHIERLGVEDFNPKERKYSFEFEQSEHYGEHIK